MTVPEIIEVKQVFSNLKNRGLISEWELPYENLLTRLSAAIFFLTPKNSSTETIDEIQSQLRQFSNFSIRPNAEMKLSNLELRVTFNKENTPN